MSTAVIGFDLTRVYTSVSPSGSGEQSPRLGQVYIDGQGNRYRFVKNLHSSTLAVGDVVFYDYTNGVSYEVARLGTGISGLDAMAGAAMGTIATNGFGWIQIAGDGTALVHGGTAVTIGDSLKGSNAQLYVIKDADIGTAPAHHNHMRVRVDYSTASGALKAVTINCHSW